VLAPPLALSAAARIRTAPPPPVYDPRPGMSPRLGVPNRVCLGIGELPRERYAHADRLELERRLSTGLLGSQMPCVSTKCAVVSQSNEVEAVRLLIDEGHGWTWKVALSRAVWQAYENDALAVGLES